MNFLGNWSYWLPMCLLAVMIAVIIHAAILMFAKGFHVQELERYAESEILQAVSTALMAMLLVGLVISANSFSSLFFGAGGKSYVTCQVKDTIRNIQIEETTAFNDSIDIARCRILEKAVAIAEVQDSVTTSAYTWFKFEMMNLGLSVFGVTIYKGEWIGALYEDTETIRITNNLATVMLIALNAVSYLLLYVKSTMLSMFIPLGIFLRSFHFTRGAGAFFISLGVGLYFIFPVIFVLLDPGFVKIDVPQTDSSIGQAKANLCYPTMSAAATMISTAASTTSGSAIAIERTSDQLTQAYVGLILHPLISFFLTLAFIRYMMVILGGDTYAMMRMVTKVI